MTHTYESKKARLEQRMVGLSRYRGEISTLQTVWDNLSLLAQLSGTGADMSVTRQSFTNVSDNVLSDLAREMLKKTVNDLASKAYVIINIVIRNLFERTADIGFLSTDDDIRAFLEKYHDDMANDEESDKLKRRFQEYVNKYSVYSDIILCDTEGNVLVQLDHNNPVIQTKDPLIQQSLNTKASYVEYFGKSDLQPQSANSLIYAYKVTGQDSHKNLGVLCLVFRFENEMTGVFSQLISEESWEVGLMLDQNDYVIASSDPFHIPIGAKLETTQRGQDWILTKFAGREYLTVTRSTNGYQGYMGPGWKGHAMIPLEYAFDNDTQRTISNIDPTTLSKVMRSPLLFSSSLLGIPKQAAMIQSQLNQSVWNGNIWQTRNAATENSKFSKVLLWEISNTGFKTQSVIERTVAELYQTVVSVMLKNSSFFAFLAVDIMDRNLYERANDCRWWALTSSFREILSKPKQTSTEINQIERVIKYINSLYTVYDNMIVFDRQGKILAVSNPAYNALLESTIEAEWLPHVKMLKNSQEYTVSKFESSPYYQNKLTYIYSAAIRSANGAVIGGIAIVFDSEPQFKAMLNDIVPRDDAGNVIPDAFTLFVDGHHKVISSTNKELPVGSLFNIKPELCDLSPGSTAFDIALHNGKYYAVGACASSGYREFKSEEDTYKNQMTALIFIPLGIAAEIDARIEADNAMKHNEFKPNSAHTERFDTTEYATFYVGHDWMGLPASDVVESVDPLNILPIPHSMSYFEGLYQYKGQVLPVLNMAKLLGIDISEHQTNKQLIIIQSATHGDRYALLVSALGEIPPISQQSIEPISNIFGNTSKLVSSGVTKIMSDDGSSKVLTIICSDKIYALMNKKPISKAA